MYEYILFESILLEFLLFGFGFFLLLAATSLLFTYEHAILTLLKLAQLRVRATLLLLSTRVWSVSLMKFDQLSLVRW
jgi:hypothetical protein